MDIFDNRFWDWWEEDDHAEKILKLAILFGFGFVIMIVVSAIVRVMLSIL